MSITATIEAGKIVLPPGLDWPNGTVVRIEPLEVQSSIWEKLKKYEGVLDDLPADMAAQHDHYIHGSSKE